MRRCTAESGHSATLRFGVESTSAVQCSAVRPPAQHAALSISTTEEAHRWAHTLWAYLHFGLVCVCFRLEQGMWRAQSHPAVMPQSVLSRLLMRDGAAYLADYTYVPWRASANLAASTRTMLWCM
jgi:hypothetical protein